MGIVGLELFRDLVKDGCQWEGDVLSSRWSERLHIPPGAQDKVQRTLAGYVEGVDYKLADYHVWIA